MILNISTMVVVLIVIVAAFSSFINASNIQNTTWFKDGALEGRTFPDPVYSSTRRDLLSCITRCLEATSSCVLVTFNNVKKTCRGHATSKSPSDSFVSDIGTISSYRNYKVTCPSSYTLSPDTSLCYYVKPGRAGHIAARAACVSDGARMVVLNTEQKFNHITNLVKQTSQVYWTGGYDKHGANDAWYWVNGEPMDLTTTFWNPDEPSHNNEGCAALEMSLKMNDRSCNDILKYICEIEL